MEMRGSATIERLAVAFASVRACRLSNDALQVGVGGVIGLERRALRPSPAPLPPLVATCDVVSTLSVRGTASCRCVPIDDGAAPLDARRQLRHSVALRIDATRRRDGVGGGVGQAPIDDNVVVTLSASTVASLDSLVRCSRRSASWRTDAGASGGASRNLSPQCTGHRRRRRHRRRRYHRRMRRPCTSALRSAAEVSAAAVAIARGSECAAPRQLPCAR